MTLRVVIVPLIAFALGTAGCGGSTSHLSTPAMTPHAAGAGRELTDLRNVNQLRVLFNKASKQPRLIILVSPT
jgi:hypothetical protein